jgi:hypothetical protein
MARALFGGEGISLSVAGRHLPEVKARWGARVRSMALLACVVGVDEEGFRELLAIEVASTEKGAAYASLLRVSSTGAFQE